MKNQEKNKYLFHVLSKIQVETNAAGKAPVPVEEEKNRKRTNLISLSIKT